MKNILIIIDMQNGFTKHPQTEGLTQRIADMLALNLFDKVIATQFINHDDSVYEKFINWRRLKKVHDRAIRPEILPYIDEIVQKNVYTCISVDFLQRLCQLNDGNYPKKLFIVGVDTDCCVLKVAVDLFEHNIRPVVLTSYCSSNSGKESHEAGILCMKKLIGEKQLTDIILQSGSDISEL